MERDMTMMGHPVLLSHSALAGWDFPICSEWQASIVPLSSQVCMTGMFVETVIQFHLEQLERLIQVHMINFKVIYHILYQYSVLHNS